MYDNNMHSKRIKISEENISIFKEVANLPFSLRVFCRSANVDNTTSSSGDKILGFMKHEVSYHAH